MRNPPAFLHVAYQTQVIVSHPGDRRHASKVPQHQGVHEIDLRGGVCFGSPDQELHGEVHEESTNAFQVHASDRPLLRVQN